MITLETLMKEYLDHCITHKKLNLKTINAYSIDLNQFLSLIPTSTLPATKEILMEYLSYIYKM